jgi:cysteine desulfurase/selenocysteine lyase
MSARGVSASSAPILTRPALDEARVRADFPILERPVRGTRLAYLDNAATAQKPRVVVETLMEFYLRHNANVHRGVHVLSEEATQAYDGAREVARRFLGAASAEEIVFTSGTTAGINLVAQAWGPANLRAGDEILLTTFEHHSNLVPWQMVAHRTGAEIRVLPIRDDGSLDLSACDRLLTSRTRMVAVSHVSNVLGTVSPLPELVRRAHRVGALVLVDGAQSAPRLPVDVRELNCDFFACSGHKLYGPTGIGILYARAELLAHMPPWITGGGMIERVTFEATSFAPPPTRFEAGTPPVAEAAGLAAALEYLERIGLEPIAAHERALRAYAEDRLAEVPELRVLGTAPGKLGVISFVLGTIHAHDVATVLDAKGVAVRAGHHCAMPLMQRLGVPATVRASLGIYNTRADVDQLVDALHEARARFRG